MPLTKKQEFENALVEVCRKFAVTLNHEVHTEIDFDYEPDQRWWFEGPEIRKGETFYLEIEDLWNAI